MEVQRSQQFQIACPTHGCSGKTIFDANLKLLWGSFLFFFERASWGLKEAVYKPHNQTAHQQWLPHIVPTGEGVRAEEICRTCQTAVPCWKAPTRKPPTTSQARPPLPGQRWHPHETEGDVFLGAKVSPRFPPGLFKLLPLDIWHMCVRFGRGCQLFVNSAGLL